MEATLVPVPVDISTIKTEPLLPPQPTTEGRASYLDDSRARETVKDVIDPITGTRLPTTSLPRSLRKEGLQLGDKQELFPRAQEPGPNQLITGEQVARMPAPLGENQIALAKIDGKLVLFYGINENGDSYANNASVTVVRRNKNLNSPLSSLPNDPLQDAVIVVEQRIKFKESQGHSSTDKDGKDIQTRYTVVQNFDLNDIPNLETLPDTWEKTENGYQLKVSPEEQAAEQAKLDEQKATELNAMREQIVNETTQNETPITTSHEELYTNDAPSEPEQPPIDLSKENSLDSPVLSTEGQQTTETHLNHPGEQLENLVTTTDDEAMSPLAGGNRYPSNQPSAQNSPPETPIPLNIIRKPMESTDQPSQERNTDVQASPQIETLPTNNTQPSSEQPEPDQTKPYAENPPLLTTDDQPENNDARKPPRRGILSFARVNLPKVKIPAFPRRKQSPPAHGNESPIGIQREPSPIVHEQEAPPSTLSTPNSTSESQANENSRLPGNSVTPLENPVRPPDKTPNLSGEKLTPPKEKISHDNDTEEPITPSAIDSNAIDENKKRPSQRSSRSEAPTILPKKNEGITPEGLALLNEMGYTTSSELVNLRPSLPPKDLPPITVDSDLVHTQELPPPSTEKGLSPSQPRLPETPVREANTGLESKLPILEGEVVPEAPEGERKRIEIIVDAITGISTGGRQSTIDKEGSKKDNARKLLVATAISIVLVSPFPVLFSADTLPSRQPNSPTQPVGNGNFADNGGSVTPHKKNTESHPGSEIVVKGGASITQDVKNELEAVLKHMNTTLTPKQTDIMIQATKNIVEERNGKTAENSGPEHFLQPDEEVTLLSLQEVTYMINRVQMGLNGSPEEVAAYKAIIGESENTPPNADDGTYGPTLARNQKIYNAFKAAGISDSPVVVKTVPWAGDSQ